MHYTIILFFYFVRFSLSLTSNALVPSPRRPGHPHPWAGPGHLAGGLCQQQLPGTHLPAHPGGHDLLPGGRVPTGGCQEWPNQCLWPGGLPGWHLRLSGADRDSQRPQAQRYDDLCPAVREHQRKRERERASKWSTAHQGTYLTTLCPLKKPKKHFLVFMSPSS